MLFGQLKAKSKPETSYPAVPTELARMVNSAGRVGLTVLQQMARTLSADDFNHLVHQPVLAGSGIHLGTLAAHSGHGSHGMNRTILFEPIEDGEDAVSASEGLKMAIYPLIKGEHATSTAKVFSIGRIDGNDFIMPDYAISKKHALIETRNGVYLLRDLGSTNGTRLNGRRLQNKAVDIHDRDIISFARYEFSFLSPASLYGMLRQT
jgi:hypothetical protein